MRLNLNQLRLDQLQEAIRANQVSFPSQVPVFIKHAEGKQQSHVVLLYFVLGWSCNRIAKRYGFTRQHIWQMVSEWRRHAVALGYLQVIPPPEVLMPVRPPRLGFPSSVAFQSEVFQPEVFQPEAGSHEMVPHEVHVSVSVAAEVAVLA